MMTFVDGLYGVLQSGGWQDNFVVCGLSDHARGRLRASPDDERRGSTNYLNEEKLPDDRWQVWIISIVSRK